MQEPMQDKEEASNEENNAAAPGAEQEATDAPATENEAEETEAKEEEIDPWEALELEVAKWKDQAVRTAAELDNYRKRMAREKQDAVRYGNQRLLEELLPVLDNFNMGMQAAAQEEGSMLYMGMDMVHKQISELGKIMRVVRKGYRIGERLLRPSNIIVSLGAKAEEPEPESE